jgi:hypothetical protein
MTQRDPADIEALLEDARRALSPRDMDQARVLAALEQRLSLRAEPSADRSNDMHSPSKAPPAAPAVGSAVTGAVTGHASLTGAVTGAVTGHAGLTGAVTSAVTGSAAVTGAGAVMGAVGSARVLVRWALRALLPVAGVGALALVATQLHTLHSNGATPSLRPAKPMAAAVTGAQPLPTKPDAATQPVDRPQLAAASEPQPGDRSESSQGDKSPPKKKPQRKKCRAANGQERPCEIKASETALAIATPEPVAPPPAAASLRRELEALRQAQSALRSGQAAQALTVLEAFERETNGPGEMQEERAAAVTMARCALVQAEPDKRELYSAFAQRYPKSPYAARLRRTCLKQP